MVRGKTRIYRKEGMKMELMDFIGYILNNDDSGNTEEEEETGEEEE